MTNAIMKKTSILLATALLLPALALAADYNLGELVKARKLELFNRSLDQKQAGAPEAVFLDAAPDDGLVWISGVELSTGTIELEIKGRDLQGQSFVGIAFHGRDNQVFDAVYLRPFNFQASDAVRKSHSIQYIAMPEHGWSNLRTNYPGKYESSITPSPAPESWVKLKLVLDGKSVSAFVNGSTQPALTVELLNDRHTGKVGLWAGNGSSGWYRNLKIISKEQTAK